MVAASLVEFGSVIVATFNIAPGIHRWIRPASLKQRTLNFRSFADVVDLSGFLVSLIYVSKLSVPEKLKKLVPIHFKLSFTASRPVAWTMDRDPD